MNHFTEYLNLTIDAKLASNHLDAVKLNTRKDINFYDTLCLYCADNNIQAQLIDDDQFDSVVDLIREYKIASVKEFDYVYFWLDDNINDLLLDN